MYILPSTKIEQIAQKGTDEQKTAATYFDKNGNGIIEAQEADSFNYSKIVKTPESLTITSPSGYTDKFINIATPHPDSFYEQGFIPVAVIDDFTMGGNGTVQHGTNVSNVIKYINPNISLTRINTSHTKYFNPIQKGLIKIFNKHPNMERTLDNHKITKKLLDLIYNNIPHLSMLAHKKSCETVKANLDNGMKYKAVNLSAGFDITYSTINELVKNELGIEITPDNISTYRQQIKDIIRNKKDYKISNYNSSGKCVYTKLSETLDVLDAIEQIKIPVYIAGSYKTVNDEETFNLWALADNAICIEGGVEHNGTIIHDSHVSHNSLAVDKNGHRRLEDSMFYDGSDELERGSNSLAVPIALAKALQI